MPASVEVLHRFLTEVAGEPAVLVGNSMGGMVSILTAARDRRAVRGLVLLDPALPGARRRLGPLDASQFLLYFLPVVGERVLRLRRQRQSPVTRVRELLALCGVDPDDVPPRSSTAR